MDNSIDLDNITYHRLYLNNRNSIFMAEKTEDSSPAKDHFSLDDEEHMAFRNYMRDVILGTNDGLVSVFALVIGVAAGSGNPKIALLAGIAGLIAGAVSMAIGEYISTKSQEEVYDAEKAIERRHIDEHFDHEKGEIREWYREKGFDGDLLEQIVETISANPDVMLNEMMLAEFGVLEGERRSPLKATIIVSIAFILGGILPVLPFIWVDTAVAGIIIAGIFSFIGLFLVGGLKSWITNTIIWKGGMENLLLGLTGAVITYFVGGMFAVSV